MYQAIISTVETSAGPYAGLAVIDEAGIDPASFQFPILAGINAADREKGQAADFVLAELNWKRTSEWTVAGTWDTPGMHMYATAEMTTAGQLTARELDLLYQPAAVAAISALLDDEDAAAVERHILGL
jgi:hypothetical protein